MPYDGAAAAQTQQLVTHRSINECIISHSLALRMYLATHYRLYSISLGSRWLNTLGVGVLYLSQEWVCITKGGDSVVVCIEYV